jgi:hypothetical protein
LGVVVLAAHQVPQTKAQTAQTPHSAILQPLAVVVAVRLPVEAVAIKTRLTVFRAAQVAAVLKRVFPAAEPLDKAILGVRVVIQLRSMGLVAVVARHKRAEQVLAPLTALAATAPVQTSLARRQLMRAVVVVAHTRELLVLVDLAAVVRAEPLILPEPMAQPTQAAAVVVLAARMQPLPETAAVVL